MPNDTRNSFEPPCYLDIGQKLFPENPEGTLDLTDPNTRDQAFIKHTIKEGQKIGFKPVKIWLFSHRDALRGHDTGAPSDGGPEQDHADFYGDGGGGPMINSDPAKNTGSNFYNELPTKVYSGPFTIKAEYMPVQAEAVLNDFGYEKTYNDVFNFLIDEAKRILGRVPYNGDLIQRFDGKILEIVSSNEFQPENWEWLYQQCKAVNTGKDDRQFFRGQE